MYRTLIRRYGSAPKMGVEGARHASLRKTAARILSTQVPDKVKRDFNQVLHTGQSAMSRTVALESGNSGQWA